MFFLLKKKFQLNKFYFYFLQIIIFTIIHSGKRIYFNYLQWIISIIYSVTYQKFVNGKEAKHTKQKPNISMETKYVQKNYIFLKLFVIL